MARLHEHPAPDEQAAWDAEYERRMFHWAADQVRPTVTEATWQAFWQTTLEGADPSQVAQRLRMGVAAVYMAKSRVLKRLKELIQEAESV